MQETTPATTDPKRRYLCRHVFTEGHRCGSPALRSQSLCYNHSRSRREAPISGRSGTFPMPRIDDRAAIQLALFEVLSRLSGGDIDYKRGGILLYGLQIASSNLPRHATQAAEQQPQIEEVTHDIHLGDLAPIAEFPNAEQPEEASLVKLERTNPDRAKMKRWLASKRQPAQPAGAAYETATTPCAPQPPATATNAAIPADVVILTLNEVKGNNPRIQPGAPLQSLTLAAVHATANHQPATATLQRSHRQNQPRFPRPLARFATPYNSE